MNSIDRRHSPARVVIGSRVYTVAVTVACVLQFHCQGTQYIRWGRKAKWHGIIFSIIELFLLPVRFSLLQYFLWENTAIIRWPPPLLPLICCLSFHELDINVSRQFYLFKDFLNVTEYSEVVAKNYCSLRTHDCRFKFETQVAATTNGFILTSK